MTNIIDMKLKRQEKAKPYATGVINALNSKTPTVTYKGLVIVSRTIADWFRSHACGMHVEQIGISRARVTLYPCDVDAVGSAKKLSLLRWWKSKRKRETWQTDSHRTTMDLNALLAYSSKLLGGNIEFVVSRRIPKNVLPYTTASAVDSIVEKQKKYWADHT